MTAIQHIASLKQKQHTPGRRVSTFTKALYADHFGDVELNFTFYRMDTAATLAKLAGNSP